MLAALHVACWVALSGVPETSTEERVVTKASVYLVKEPSFLAPRASTIAIQRGEKVKLEGEPKGAWYLVSWKPRKGARVQGYIHASYVSDRPVAFKVDEKDVKGTGQVSGNYNLAVPGFREEIAQKREKGKKDAAQGYQVIEKYMPLSDSEATRARLASPADPTVLRTFAYEGRLREPGVAVEPAPVSVPPSATASAPPTGAPTAVPAAAATKPASATSATAAVPARPAVAAPIDELAPGGPSGPMSDPSEWGGP